MKKREVTPEELKEIIAYRKLGTTWTKIEEKTKVERRAAKRAYTEWKIDEDVSEQDALRFRINAEAWNEHMNDLVSLASGLVSKLRLPPKFRKKQ
jgi:glutamyl/glutaminyl-tRNA synthetase